MLADQDLFVIVRQSGVGEAQVVVLQLAVPCRQQNNKQDRLPQSRLQIIMLVDQELVFIVRQPGVGEAQVVVL